jgi:hypothetical protein
MKTKVDECDPATAALNCRLRVGIFALWLLIVVFLAWHHAFSRDEVRAFSIALKGDNTIAMLAGLHGEGHPALWYLLLRAAHFLIGGPEVLPLLSLAIAASAILLLALRSPFRWPVVALIAFSHFAIFEYSVMARNYGISMLLLFILAWVYPRRRDSGIVLGVLLFLLSNTNVHSALLVASFLLFWLIDLLLQDGLRWTPALRMYIVNALIASAGVVACVATVYPTYNDAAVIDRTGAFGLKLLIKAVLIPAESFADLAMNFPKTAIVFAFPSSLGHLGWLKWPMSLAMFGSGLGLIRSPGALIASVASLIGLSILFTVVYQGRYRHEALWLVFLVTMYWITLTRGANKQYRFPDRLEPSVKIVSRTGWALLILLLALQVPDGMKAIADVAFGSPPNSQSREFAAFVVKQPQFKNAIIIADPDFLLEPLPYYLPNRTYLMREQRFGTIVIFTKKALLRLTLDDMLASARELQTNSGEPILILVRTKLNPSDPGRIVKEGYNWTLVLTPEQVRRFLGATRMLASFSPSEQDESFDVYLLKSN